MEVESCAPFVRLGLLGGGEKVACHVRRDWVDICTVVGCVNRFVCVEIVSVYIGGVYSECGAREHEILHWLGRV